MNFSLTIGKLAQQSGLSVDTLRYYERIGLLPGVERVNRQRRYSTDHLQRLHFIRRAQSMDFSLQEIGQLLQLRESPEESRSEVRELAKEKLSAITARLETLQKLHGELSQLVECCQSSGPGPCPIIKNLETDPRTESEHEH